MQKKRLLRNSRLYVILDKDICVDNRGILNIAKQIEAAGADIIQLRYKSDNINEFVDLGIKLRSVINQRKVLFIINDRTDVAFACNADGVHLGQDDISPKIARRLLGEKIIIGLSCHSLKQAQEAQKNPYVDYIGIGPIFSTTLKPEYKPIGLEIISKINRRITKPFFPIGGINLKNLRDVLQSGVKRVALCRAICESENIFESTKLIKEILLG